MSFITLLSKNVAKKGYQFQYNGDTQICKKCEFYPICHEKLEKGRIYEVIKVKNKKQQCLLIDNTVLPVEVKEIEYVAIINTEKAIEGAVIEFTPIQCDQYACSNKDLCSPPGLKNKDKVQILTIMDNVDCERNKILKKVKLKRIAQ